VHFHHLAWSQVDMPLERTLYFAAGAPSAIALGADPVTGAGGAAAASGGAAKGMLGRARALSGISFAGPAGAPGESLPIGQATFVVFFTGGGDVGGGGGVRATVGGTIVPEDHPRAQVCIRAKHLGPPRGIFCGSMP
jgi:hypothetical protein